MESLKPDLSNSELITEPDIYRPELSTTIQQTLARLFVYDSERQLFRLARGDISGRIFVSQAFPITVENTVRIITAISVNNDYLKSNEKRVRFIIANRGHSTALVSYANVYSTSNYLPLYPGQTLIDEEYKGSVSINLTVGTPRVFVSEFVER